MLAVRHVRRTNEFEGMIIKPRQMTAAVAVGGVVGFTQTIPLVLLPAVFEYVLQYNPPILATAAIAPFAVALIAAGPVAGIVLARYSPRAVLLTGTATLGIGAIALGLAFGVFGRGTSYLWLILPSAAIGAGFVVSTTVRTALIFAATPRGLPATAAGYNEASVALGARVGIVASTIFVASVATNSLNRCSPVGRTSMRAWPSSRRSSRTWACPSFAALWPMSRRPIGCSTRPHTLMACGQRSWPVA